MVGDGVGETVSVGVGELVGDGVGEMVGAGFEGRAVEVSRMGWYRFWRVG